MALMVMRMVMRRGRPRGAGGAAGGGAAGLTLTSALTNRTRGGDARGGIKPTTTSLLRDERARAVRRSRTELCGQHDMLAHLISRALDLTR